MNKISNSDLNELKKQYQGEALDIVLNKVESGYPVQYLIGNVNFCGNIINVSEDVLIPRFETEFLIDLIKNKIDTNANNKIIDLGTGSGCIAITIAKIFTNSEVEGIDISKKAIDIANTNKKMNLVTNVTFKQKDINDIKNFDEYNIIISNPPYVSKSEEVGPETKYEPQNAIFAENDGLYFYEEIIKKVSNSNQKPSDIFFEIGMNQGSKIKDLSTKLLFDYKCDIYKDLAGKERYIHIYVNK